MTFRIQSSDKSILKHHGVLQLLLQVIQKARCHSEAKPIRHYITTPEPTKFSFDLKLCGNVCGHDGLTETEISQKYQNPDFSFT